MRCIRFENPIDFGEVLSVWRGALFPMAYSQPLYAHAFPKGPLALAVYFAITLDPLTKRQIFVHPEDVLYTIQDFYCLRLLCIVDYTPKIYKLGARRCRQQSEFRGRLRMA